MECTPELLSQALDNPATARVCAEIEDALEKVRRGEMSRDDFETLKAQKKKQLPIITPHAMFKSGRRLNSDAVASGLGGHPHSSILAWRIPWTEDPGRL